MKKLMVVLLVLLFAAPAMAAEWNWYGSAKILLGWTSSSSSNALDNGSPADTRWTNGLGKGNVLNQNSSGTAAIGARVQATDAISGWFEIGNATNSAGVSETAKFRHLVGTWNFGAGKLSVGHTNTILQTVPYAVNSIDDDPWLSHGFFYEGRQDQITLQFGGFQFSALRNAATNYAEAQNKVRPAKDMHVKAVIPKLEAAYTWKADAFQLKGGVGFQTFDARTYDAAGNKGLDDDVTSWMFLLDARYSPGPWWVGLGGWYGINASEYGMTTKASAADYHGLNFGEGQFIGGKYKDSETYSIYLVGGVTLNEMVGLGAGVSYMASSFDHGDFDDKDDAWNWFLQAPLTLTKGVRIIPEVGGHYYGKDKDKIAGTSVKQGDWHYFSTKFQIDF